MSKGYEMGSDNMPRPVNVTIDATGRPRLQLTSAFLQLPPAEQQATATDAVTEALNHKAAVDAFLGDLDARGSGRLFVPAMEKGQEFSAAIPSDAWADDIRTLEHGLPKTDASYLTQLGRGVLSGTIQRSDR